MVKLCTVSTFLSLENETFCKLKDSSIYWPNLDASGLVTIEMWFIKRFKLILRDTLYTLLDLIIIYGRTDRQTDGQSKRYIPPDLSNRDIKIMLL